jgi:NAD kinase
MRLINVDVENTMLYHHDINGEFFFTNELNIAKQKIYQLKLTEVYVDIFKLKELIHGLPC